MNVNQWVLRVNGRTATNTASIDGVKQSLIALILIEDMGIRGGLAFRLELEKRYTAGKYGVKLRDDSLLNLVRTEFAVSFWSTLG